MSLTKNWLGNSWQAAGAVPLSFLFIEELLMTELSAFFSPRRHLCVMDWTKVASIRDGWPFSCSQGHNVFTLGLFCCSLPSYHCVLGTTATSGKGFWRALDLNEGKGERGSCTSMEGFSVISTSDDNLLENRHQRWYRKTKKKKKKMRKKLGDSIPNIIWGNKNWRGMSHKNT